MKHSTGRQSEVFWPRIVMRKWLNIRNKESDFGADPDEGDTQSDSDDEDFERNKGQASNGERRGDGPQFGSNGISSEPIPKLQRRNSETLRSQYIDTKEIRICVGTWNVGGKLPPDGLDINEWLCTDECADIYVLGFQEVVPLNAGNIFGVEDTRPVPQWENIIREALNIKQPLKKFKSYSDPPSPSRFQPLDEFPDIEDELLLETDSEGDGEEIHPSNDEPNYAEELNDETVTSKSDVSFTKASTFGDISNLVSRKENVLLREFSSPKRLNRLSCLRIEGGMESSEPSPDPKKGMLTRALSRSERVGLSWPEPPMNLLPQVFVEKSNSFKSTKSFRTYNSFRSSNRNDSKRSEEISFLTDMDLESIIYRKRRSPYVRIVSKQMVGIFLSVWVRRSLRKHIQNLKVSTVGVGAMGYIGNKGSVSVSMSIYQTLFCFVCTHLSSGEKSGDELRRNADVHDIHRRTHFHPVSGVGFAKTILDHERIIWLGDLNYRINLSYERVRELISRKEWSKLFEKDQLHRELKKGGAFDGWKEGTLNFSPTYKYELNSKKYYGDDPKVGRRTPAWCDRILSSGKGLRLVNYKRNEIILSDHRPVTAIFMAEVEVFSHKKLLKALTFTDAELEHSGVIQDVEFDVGMSSLVFAEDTSVWER
ncbi:hypothetical protein Syun_004845 [Stephania yunnanensis]|uniref:Inositol polyphosphate-related phosphatase domain-containing protein n=1 Tax=Stephania yunnanensis TaxID=152371 RepID=A0AAP0Q1N3_9MAGN